MQEILLFTHVSVTLRGKRSPASQRVRGLKSVGLLFNFYIALQRQSMGYCHADGKEENSRKNLAKVLKVREQTVFEACG